VLDASTNLKAGSHQLRIKIARAAANGKANRFAVASCRVERCWLIAPKVGFPFPIRDFVLACPRSIGALGAPSQRLSPFAFIANGMSGMSLSLVLQDDLAPRATRGPSHPLSDSTCTARVGLAEPPARLAPNAWHSAACRSHCALHGVLDSVTTSLHFQAIFAFLSLMCSSSPASCMRSVACGFICFSMAMMIF